MEKLFTPTLALPMYRTLLICLALLVSCTDIHPVPQPPATLTVLTETDKQLLAQRICSIGEYAVYEESTENFRARLYNNGYYWNDTQATYHLMDGDGCYPTRLFILTKDAKLYVAMAETMENAHLGTSVCEMSDNPDAPFANVWHCRLDLDTLIIDANRGKMPPPGVWQTLANANP